MITLFDLYTAPNTQMRGINLKLAEPDYCTCTHQSVIYYELEVLITLLVVNITKMVANSTDTAKFSE